MIYLDPEDPRGKAPATYRWTHRPMSPRPWDFAFPANRTLHTTWALEGDFYLLRCLYANPSASPATLTAAAIAPTAYDNLGAGGLQPVDAAGSALPWTNVTFDGAGADAEPLTDITGTTRSITIPAAVANGGDSSQAVPSIVFSDWMRVFSVPNVDPASPFRFLMHRQHHANANFPVSGSSVGTNWTTSTFLSRGRYCRGVHAAGDNATTPGAMTGVTVDGRRGPYAIQYIRPRAGVVILGVGDSLTEGLSTTANMYSWGHIAAANLADKGNPVCWVNGGWGGSQAPNYARRGKIDFDAVKPGIVTMPAATANGVSNVADANKALTHSFELANYVRQRGAVPILISPAPAIGLPYDIEEQRVALCSTLRDMEDRGDILLIDADLVLRDPTNPKVIYPLYKGDNTHWSDRGNEVLGEHAAQVFEKALR